MSEIITAKEAAKKWGICERRVRILCVEGRIDGAKKIGLVLCQDLVQIKMRSSAC